MIADFVTEELVNRPSCSKAYSFVYFAPGNTYRIKIHITKFNDYYYKTKKYVQKKPLVTGEEKSCLGEKEGEANEAML